MDAPHFVQGQYSVAQRDAIFAKANKYPDTDGGLVNQVPTLTQDGTIIWRQQSSGGGDGTANANIAIVEDTSTASQAYAIGDLLVYSGQLYRVTAAINIGGTIAPGTNVTPTTVADELDSSGGVTSFNGRTGPVTPASGDYTAEQVGAVPTNREVNGKALSADVTLGASDVGAVIAPSAAGTVGQVLKLTATGTEWANESGGVTSFNNRTGAVTPQASDYAAFYGEKLTEAMNIYVATTGSDSADGSEATPFATIQHALDVIPKNLNGYNATIHVADGTYTENLNIAGFFSGAVAFNVNTTTWGTTLNGTVSMKNCEHVNFYMGTINVPATKVGVTISSCRYVNNGAHVIQGPSTSNKAAEGVQIGANSFVMNIVSAIKNCNYMLRGSNSTLAVYDNSTYSGSTGNGTVLWCAGQLVAYFPGGISSGWAGTSISQSGNNIVIVSGQFLLPHSYT